MAGDIFDLQLCLDVLFEYIPHFDDKINRFIHQPGIIVLRSEIQSLDIGAYRRGFFVIQAVPI